MKFLMAIIILFIPMTSQAADSIIRDFSYGSEPKQSMDIYLPGQSGLAPVIFMVHGGGWKNGDKKMSRVVENKTLRWVPAGFLFISVNYPMLPESGVAQQAADIAKALAVAQKNAVRWGGDKNKFILMGHSAGGHLISLINANPDIAYRAGAGKWLGSVSLDSAGLDIVSVMKARHMKLYDDAFGSMTQAEQEEVSPYHQLNAKALPWFGVCSSLRDTSCTQSNDFVAKAKSLGVEASYIKEDLKHSEINEYLGQPGEYTSRVENFMASLDKDVAARLSGLPKTGNATISSKPKAERPLRDMLRRKFSDRLN